MAKILRAFGAVDGFRAIGDEDGFMPWVLMEAYAPSVMRTAERGGLPG